jgi:hypothetical protein
LAGYLGWRLYRVTRVVAGDDGDDDEDGQKEEGLCLKQVDGDGHKSDAQGNV